MFGWVPGVGGKLKDAAANFDIFRANVNSALGGAAADANIAGQAIGAGLSAGMRSKLAQVNADAAALAGAAIRGVRTTAGIRSPSTVFAELGALSAQGFALGLDRHAHLAAKASANLVRGALGAAAFQLPGPRLAGLDGAPVPTYGRQAGSSQQTPQPPSVSYTANITTPPAVALSPYQVLHAFRVMEMSHG